MEISQLDLLVFCAASLLVGAFLGAVYDLCAVMPMLGGRIFLKDLRERLSGITLPIIKKEIKTRFVNNNISDFTVGFSIFIHDLIFMIFSGIVTAMLVYRFNDGKWRYYVLIFEIIGFCFYRITARKFFLYFVEVFRFFLKCIVLYFESFFILPIKTVFFKIYNIYKKKKLIRTVNKYSKKKKKEIIRSAHYSGCFNTKQ